MVMVMFCRLVFWWQRVLRGVSDATNRGKED